MYILNLINFLNFYSSRLFIHTSMAESANNAERLDDTDSSGIFHIVNVPTTHSIQPSISNYNAMLDEIDPLSTDESHVNSQVCKMIFRCINRIMQPFYPVGYIGPRSNELFFDRSRRKNRLLIHGQNFVRSRTDPQLSQCNEMPISGRRKPGGFRGCSLG